MSTTTTTTRTGVTTTVTRADGDEGSDTFHVTVTTKAGRIQEYDTGWDDLQTWLWHFKRAEKLSLIVIRE
jgi:hypothetical protein